MYNQLALLIMTHGCNLTVSPFNTFQARVKEFGAVGWSSTLHKSWSGSLAKEETPPPTAGVLNCTPLSTLSCEFVSGAFNYNNSSDVFNVRNQPHRLTLTVLAPVTT